MKQNVGGAMNVDGPLDEFKYTGWHIELTNRCPLACPACIRTMHGPGAKSDIDTNLLLNFLSNPEKYDYIFFQGNLGDPIYHPDFHKISEHFFPANELQVTTNGMQTKEFWQRVLKTWPESSIVELSIDGLQDTNSIYRVNSNWNKIQELFELIATTKRKCQIRWKYIVFEHNHHQVEEAIALSKKLGINEFKIKKSWTIHDDMSNNGQIKDYYNPEWFDYVKRETLDELAPFCYTGDMHYINSQGNYYPCCWIDNDISSLGHISEGLDSIKDKFLNFSNLLTWSKCPEVCREMCCKISDNDKEMITPNSVVDRKIIVND